MRKNKNKTNLLRGIKTADSSMYQSERLAYSPAEFARLCGRSTTFAYRRIYDGSVQVISGFGRMLIPKSEIEKFLAKAGVYDGLKSKSEKPQKGTHGN